MTRPFYCEYIRHALRFYSRHLDQTQFKSEADKSNWLACKEVLGDLSENDRSIIISIYSGFDTLSDNIYEVAQRRNINQSVIWDLTKEVERKIARKRGLL